MAGEPFNAVVMALETYSDATIMERNPSNALSTLYRTLTFSSCCKICLPSLNTPEFSVGHLKIDAVLRCRFQNG